jgi:hypothetical protein
VEVSTDATVGFLIESQQVFRYRLGFERREPEAFDIGSVENDPTEFGEASYLKSGFTPAVVAHVKAGEDYFPESGADHPVNLGQDFAGVSIPEVSANSRENAVRATLIAAIGNLQPRAVVAAEIGNGVGAVGGRFVFEQVGEMPGKDLGYKFLFRVPDDQIDTFHSQYFLGVAMGVTAGDYDPAGGVFPCGAVNEVPAALIGAVSYRACVYDVKVGSFAFSDSPEAKRAKPGGHLFRLVLVESAAGSLDRELFCSRSTHGIEYNEFRRKVTRNSAAWRNGDQVS